VNVKNAGLSSAADFCRVLQLIAHKRKSWREGTERVERERERERERDIYSERERARARQVIGRQTKAN